MNALPDTLLQNLIEKVSELSMQLATLAGAVNQFQKTVDKMEQNHAEEIKELKKIYHEKFNNVAPLALVMKHQEVIEKWERESVQKEAIKNNHKTIISFFLGNWRFLTSICVGLPLLVGGLDWALERPSLEQQKTIKHLEYQIEKLQNKN